MDSSLPSRHQFPSAKSQIEQGRPIFDLPSAEIYQLPSVFVDWDGKITDRVREISHQLFDDWVSPELKGYKQSTKKILFCSLVLAAAKAKHRCGTVRCSRDLAQESAMIRLQVIDAAVSSKLFYEVRSPKGSPSMSRLIASDTLEQMLPTDPWEFDPADEASLVRLVERNEDRTPIPFDPELPVPKRYWRFLILLNEVNKRYEIDARRYLPKRQEFAQGIFRLRPIHYAVFTGSFDLHGRIYTGRFGHQALRRIERQWIRFDREPSVEYDFSSFHTRMLYHLEGLECLSDPYHLWGDSTTDDQRAVVKQLMNSLINADSQVAAIRACNHAMHDMKNGRKKTGKDLEDARYLRDAVTASKLNFAQLLPLVQERHYRISHHFCADTGIKLMNRDSRIALNVLRHFARQDIPCLGVHDSFIVPAHAEAELKETMYRCYRSEVGDFSPVIK